MEIHPEGYTRLTLPKYYWFRSYFESFLMVLTLRVVKIQ